MIGIREYRRSVFKSAFVDGSDSKERDNANEALAYSEVFYMLSIMVLMR